MQLWQSGTVVAPILDLFLDDEPVKQLLYLCAYNDSCSGRVMIDHWEDDYKDCLNEWADFVIGARFDLIGYTVFANL